MPDGVFYCFQINCVIAHTLIFLCFKSRQTFHQAYQDLHKLCCDILFPGGTYEPRCEKTGLRAVRPGPTQTRLYNHTRWLEAGNFVYRKKRDCTIYVANTRVLISFAADLHLCLRICKKPVFSRRGSNIRQKLSPLR